MVSSESGNGFRGNDVDPVLQHNKMGKSKNKVRSIWNETSGDQYIFYIYYFPGFEYQKHAYLNGF